MHNYFSIANDMLRQQRFFTLFLFLMLAPFAFLKAAKIKRMLEEKQNAERKQFFKYTMH